MVKHHIFEASSLEQTFWSELTKVNYFMDKDFKMEPLHIHTIKGKSAQLGFINGAHVNMSAITVGLLHATLGFSQSISSPNLSKLIQPL